MSKFKELLPRLVKRRSPFDYIVYTLALIMAVGMDQLTKLIVLNTLELGKPVTVIRLFGRVILQWNHVQNDGAAFGMLDQAPWVFNTFSVVAITALLLYLYLGHASSEMSAVSMVMIAGGGIGNMIDRTFRVAEIGGEMKHYVVDFIDFDIINFAVFNVADMLVCIGAGLLILSLILELVKEARAKKQNSPSTEDKE